MFASLGALALAAGAMSAAPAARADTDPSTVASPSAPNASGSPAPAPPDDTGSTPGAAAMTPIPAARGGSPAEQGAMATAAARAKASGTSVVVDALTSEVQQVVAQPNGTFTLAANTAPVRTKQNGVWAPIDTRLHKNPDGTLSPNATAYGTVRFSGGGSTPLAATSSGQAGYTLSWPTALPTPTISGNWATYPEVLPGVDLRVSATDTGGFSEVLIVKTPAAAKNPALAKLTLTTRVSGGQLHPAPGGGFTLTTSGSGRYLTSGTALMWDSNTSLAAANPAAAKKAVADHVALSPDASDAGHAGLAARIAPVTVTAGAGTLTLVPDTRLLTSPAAVFPEFIDPTVDWHLTPSGTPDYVDREQGSPCNNTSFWDAAPQLGNTGEHALGIGHNLWSSCIGLMDPYFQWHLPSAINGAIIGYATVKVTRNYSSACGSGSTATLHWSGGINSGTKWDTAKPTDLGHTVSATWPTNTGLNCSGGDIAEGFDLTGAVAANTYASQITVELEADGDPSGSNGVYWYGNIQPNPTLEIEYNHPAGVPINLSAVTGSDNVGCATAPPYPYMGKTLATNTPILQAQVSDPDGGHVQAQFKYWIDGSSTSSNGLSADNLSSGATAQYSLPAGFVNSLTNGQVVDWQVQATDGGPYSAWSQTCHFTAEPTGPDAPTIVNNTTYPNTSTGGGIGAAAGTPATFTINGDTDGAPATGFVYALDQPPATSNPPANQIAAVTGTTASGVQDRWKLTDGSGPTGADSAGSHPVTLGPGASWTTDATRQAALVSTSAATSYATTSGPVLNTTASYSVSAWVKLTSTNGDAVAVSQAGTNIGAFFLGYDANKTGWCFYGYNADVMSSGLTNWPGVCPTTDHPALNTWTQLTGVYDAAAKTRSLYVNGTLIGTGSDTTAFTTNGVLSIGDERYNAAPAFNFPGEISDVQAYTRALSATDVNAMFAAANVTIAPPSDGPHTLYVYARDAAGDVSGTQAYPLLAAGHPTITCASFTACLNNTAITPDTGPFKSAVTGMCMDDANGSTADGNTVQIYQCLGNANQNWTVHANSTIQFQGHCLDVIGGGTAVGTKVQLYTCISNDANQVWQAQSDGAFMNPHSGLCLDDPHGTTTNGTQLWIYTCNNSPAQVWNSISTQGSADGYSTLSANDLTNAGWTPGAHLTLDGTPFTLPGYGASQPDNIIAENQTIPITGAGNALSLLVTGTDANANLQADDPNYNAAPYVPVGTGIVDNWCFLGTNAQAPCAATTGTVTYTDGTTHTYDLTVPDWVAGPTALAAVTLSHRNSPAGQQTLGTKLYDFTIPLLPGKTIASIQLPDLAGNLSTGAPALHVFAMSLRNNTNTTPKVDGTTATAPTGSSWTGAWANPSEGQYNFQGSNFTNQTFRIALKPSISGAGLRIKLDNALGTNALNIGHATLALDTTSGGLPTAQPNGGFTPLTFAGQPGTTIPAGAMAYSDPLPYTVTANQYLLLSFTLTNTVPYLVQHSWANTAYEYLSAPGSGDKTTDAGPAFTGTGTYQGWFTDLLTDLDVNTASIPTTAVLGDSLIDAWQPNTSPIGSTSIRLSDDLAATEPSTPAPYGTLAEGIESNFLLKDNPETYSGGAVGGPSALSRLDRDILDHPGITTVIVDQGLEDILAGQNPTALESAYNILDRELTGFGITPVYLTLTPCDGYTGDGATPNDPCTTTIDTNRKTLNAWIENSTNADNLDPAIGIPDTTNGATKLDPNADVSDHVNLTIPGYAAIANTIEPAQDCWPLNDGQGGNPATAAADGCNPTTPQNATLTGTYTWPTDPTRGTVLGLDGTTGYGATGSQVLNTAASFTVSAWVNLPTLPTRNAAIAAQDGTTNSGFYLGYDYSNTNKPAWALYFANTDTANTGFSAAASPTATTGWTHLVGVYNATTKTAQLYLNGTLTATTTNITTWNATGAFTIGRDEYNTNPTDYFPGQISNLSTWNYALTAPQITALYEQIS